MLARKIVYILFIGSGSGVTWAITAEGGLEYNELYVLYYEVFVKRISYFIPRVFVQGYMAFENTQRVHLAGSDGRFMPPT